MNFGSLFAGIGGFDLGFERASMECAWQVDNDERANAVLERHWPNVERYGDVQDVGKHNLKAVDLICGGFPCQDVSVAGKRKGLAGKRSGLWFEFHRILEELAPRWVVVENVPGLLSSNGGRGFAIILRGLVEIGYGVCWRILDAQYFGVAQRRRRVFIVGHLGDGCAAEVLFEREGGCWYPPPSRGKEKGIAAPIKASPPSRRNAGSAPITGELIVANTVHTREGQRREPTSDQFVVVYDTTQITSPENRSNPRPRDPCHTLAKGSHPPLAILGAYNWQSGGDVRHSFGLPSLTANQVPAVGVRRLTPTECERLQGFPDGWTGGQSDARRYKQLGNAVAVPVAEWIGKRITET